MKYAAGISIVILFFFNCACEEGSNTCKVSDPVADLPWLSQEIAHLEAGRESDPLYRYRFAAKARYQGKVVFFFSYCCPPCSSTIPAVTLRNCAGDEVAEYNMISEGKLSFQKTIWEAEGFPCK